MLLEALAKALEALAKYKEMELDRSHGERGDFSAKDFASKEFTMHENVFAKMSAVHIEVLTDIRQNLASSLEDQKTGSKTIDAAVLMSELDAAVAKLRFMSKGIQSEQPERESFATCQSPRFHQPSRLISAPPRFSPPTHSPFIPRSHNSSPFIPRSHNFLHTLSRPLSPSISKSPFRPSSRTENTQL